MALPDQMQMKQNAQGQHAQALMVAEWDKAFGHGGSPFGGCVDGSGRRPGLPMVSGKMQNPPFGGGSGEANH